MLESMLRHEFIVFEIIQITFTDEILLEDNSITLHQRYEFRPVVSRVPAVVDIGFHDRG
ncbi:hypothetical protein D3C80_1901400 [compost metagenome]